MPIHEMCSKLQNITLIDKGDFKKSQEITYLTDNENSPGVLSLGRTRNAPSRCM